jgi:hypothetical protein
LGQINATGLGFIKISIGQIINQNAGLKGIKMEKVTAYKAPGGILETNPLRAFAWKLHHISKQHSEFGSPGHKIEFSEALWLLENKEAVKALIADYEKELL